jgi:aminomethyltransferase
MKKTPLFDRHLSLGAKMVPFGGWEMPVQYRSIVEEHLHTRERAGLFDICHMSEFELEGEGAPEALDRLLSSRPSTLNVGRCRYGMMLSKDGGVIDDVIAYRLSEQKYMLVVNAATAAADKEHILGHLGADVHFCDRSADLAKIDLQGPMSFDVLADVLGYNDLALKYFSFCQFGDVLVSRTGYTGELGVELYVPSGRAVELWDQLLADERVLPIGLGARDTLRLECALSLYGHELGEDIPAHYCGVSRFLSKEGGYLGFEALSECDPNCAMETVGLMSLNKSAPRAGEKVVFQDDVVGEVTSGSYAPSLGHGIALARVSAEALRRGGAFEVDRGRRRVPVELVEELPFFKGGSARRKLG